MKQKSTKEWIDVTKQQEDSLIKELTKKLTKDGFVEIHATSSEVNLFRKGKKKLGSVEFYLSAWMYDSKYEITYVVAHMTYPIKGKEKSFDVELSYNPHDGEIEGYGDLYHSLIQIYGE